MSYLGAVFYDPGLFRKSEVRQRPVSRFAAYSTVAYCVDSIAEAICSTSPFRGFNNEKRLQYTIQILMEQQKGLRNAVKQKVMQVYPRRIPLLQKSQSISQSREISP
jgi:hypothetical protein